MTKKHNITIKEFKNNLNELIGKRNYTDRKEIAYDIGTVIENSGFDISYRPDNRLNSHIVCVKSEHANADIFNISFKTKKTVEGLMLASLECDEWFRQYPVLGKDIENLNYEQIAALIEKEYLEKEQQTAFRNEKLIARIRDEFSLPVNSMEELAKLIFDIRNITEREGEFKNNLNERIYQLEDEARRRNYGHCCDSD